MEAGLTRWIGRSESFQDEIRAAPFRALSATLDTGDPPPAPGTPLPPLWHWLYFLPTVPASGLADDGHERRGGFLPPVDLPRRMWAGGRFRFIHPLRVGDVATRTSTIADVKEKTGRTGHLVFVVVRHEIRNDDGLAIVEEQDIVYREGPREASGRRDVSEPTKASADWTRRITPDAVLLFRYSALTFNGHRIHYDREYATGREGYPGLVVHGPLVATLLLDLVRRQRPDLSLREFQFRAVRALFDTAPFDVSGRQASPGEFELWAAGDDGAVAVLARAAIRVSAEARM